MTTRDEARYWSRIAIFHTAPAFDDSEKILKIRLFVSTKYTKVTDGQTDTAGRHRPRLLIASRGNHSELAYDVFVYW